MEKVIIENDRKYETAYNTFFTDMALEIHPLELVMRP